MAAATATALLSPVKEAERRWYGSAAETKSEEKKVKFGEAARSKRNGGISLTDSDKAELGSFAFGLRVLG